MADKNWPRGRGEAANLSNLTITTDYLDSDYEIFRDNLVRGETGLLRVFSLNPKTQGRPRFCARVDDGALSQTTKSPELDIDIEDVSDSIRNDFKANRNGYCGHHTDRSSDPQQRIFEVEIAIPSGKVFQGDDSFNVASSVAASLNGQSSLRANTMLIRSERLCCRIRSLF